MHRWFIGEALALAVILLTGSPRGSLAQETGTPIFQAPYRAFTSYEFGAAFSDYEGVSFALEGFYRYGLGTNDLSLRAGFSDLNGSLGNQILVGGDFRAQLLEYGEGVPLDGSLTVGLEPRSATVRISFVSRSASQSAAGLRWRAPRPPSFSTRTP